MTQEHSGDTDIKTAADKAAVIVKEVLDGLAPAQSFDYGGHVLQLGDYELCQQCTSAIAEAQQAREALAAKARTLEDQTVREHVLTAADLMRSEAEAAITRAELHNGARSEPIVNELLGFIYKRQIHDRPEHSHQGKEQ